MNITPTEEYKDIAKKIGVPHLYLKREDMHPLGSHKGRSIPVMIDAYIGEGFKKFSISSSGNAAIAAGTYIQKLNTLKPKKILLDIYIGKNISPEKKKTILNLADEYIKVSEKERPLQAFLESMKLSDVKGLRQSTDDVALVGYVSLAQELLEIPNLSAVFVATSSGTTAEALGEYFIKNKKNVAIYIVQTSSCHPIAEIFDKGAVSDE
ncbi:MAG TPA: PLP-dependent lyase/thiolase, partial [Candidatus Paceibacterota bacterium]|nr:PLP-dependent lyase/thiolase [Candidatus Paceibacterota bacterium]